MHVNINPVLSDICSRSWLLSQVERYAFNVVENGTMVNEEVDVDVDEQTEVIRVRKQDDVDALEIMNDFIAVIYESLIHD